MVIRSRENLFGAYAFLIGIILAVAVGIFTAINPLIVTLLVALGLIVGYFVSEKDVQTFLLASVSVVIVSFAGLQGFFLNAAILGIGLNKVVTSILGALLVLFIPATIVVALKTVFSLTKS